MSKFDIIIIIYLVAKKICETNGKFLSFYDGFLRFLSSEKLDSSFELKKIDNFQKNLQNYNIDNNISIKYKVQKKIPFVLM